MTCVDMTPNPLILRQSFPLHPDPRMPIIETRRGIRPWVRVTTDSFALSWVCRGLVVAILPSSSMRCAVSRHHDSFLPCARAYLNCACRVATLFCVFMRSMRARVSWCRVVVTCFKILICIDKSGQKPRQGHDRATTGRAEKTGLRASIPLNNLKTLEKGDF